MLKSTDRVARTADVVDSVSWMTSDSLGRNRLESELKNEKPRGDAHERKNNRITTQHINIKTPKRNSSVIATRTT